MYNKRINQLTRAITEARAAIRQLQAEIALNESITELSAVDRFDIVRNPSTPASELRILAKDQDSTIRQYVMMHPNADEDILQLGLEDADHTVAIAAMHNPNVTDDLVLQGSNHADTWVRREANQIRKTRE